MYGDLTMKNVTITSGYASSEAISEETQPYTFGRGGGIAVWGIATLKNCTISGNKAEGDLSPAGIGVPRRRHLCKSYYSGGLYRQRESVTGYGAAGGGIYSVGGADNEDARKTKEKDR